MIKALGNGCCCGLLRSSGGSSSSNNRTTTADNEHRHHHSGKNTNKANRDYSYTAMTKEEARGSSDLDKIVKFGPMLLKESTCRTALLVSTTVDDGFFGMQNVLAKAGWQSAIASSEEEAEERFVKLWPYLIIVDARRTTGASTSSTGGKNQQRRKSINVELIIRKLRSLTEEDGTVILAADDKLSNDKYHRELLDAGASKLLKCCPKSLSDELHLLERTILPVQLRLRSCAALFAALEHVDNAVEITSGDRIVQYINNKYEQLTGCHKEEVLGTYSSDLRRKSLPKDGSQHHQHQHHPQHHSSSGSTSTSSGGGGNRAPSLAVVQQHNDPAASAVVDKRNTVAVSLSPALGRQSIAGASAVEQNCDDFGWKCITVAGPSSHHCTQFVHVKSTSGLLDAGKNGLYQRPPTLRFNHPTVDTPVSEIIGLLKDVQKRCEHDEEIQKPIEQAVTILNSAELYSPLIRFKQEDKVASDLFGGLVLNAPVSTLQRGRKASLSEAMRGDLNKLHQRGGAGLLRLVSPDIRAVLQLEETWKFDILELERLTLRKPLVHLGMKILERWRVREFLQCSEPCLRGWLEVIEANYHPNNSYHNSTHAADVLQATAYYLGKDAVANAIEHADAVAALLASIIHDVDHPGKGSAFLINTKHPLALLYNDVSVLECHHAALGFQLTLSDHRVNIFARLNRQDYTNLRKSIVDMVLATDMNKHFEHLAKFHQTVLATDTTPPEADRLDPRRTICRLLIKCADVSNPTRPWSQCKDWAYRIVEEYFMQTAEERAKGLPLTMEVFDRETCNVPRTQCSFIDMFIREMFDSWSKFGNMPELTAHVEDNYAHWQEEGKIWPQQRAAEYENIQRYMKQRDALRHIGAGAGPHRLSLDAAAIGAGGGFLTSAASAGAQQQPVAAEQQQQQQQYSSPSSMIVGDGGGNALITLATTTEGGEDEDEAAVSS